jgi:hypothetical protein
METSHEDIAELEKKLNDFDLAVRIAALQELAELVQQGAVTWDLENPVVNMHAHTFYSFNAYGYSPSALAWLAKKRGFQAMGIVDFDVLDGVDEFLAACDLLGVRGSGGIESRVFVPEYADKEINSPGEPGVYYHMGIGFTTSQVPDAVAGILTDLGRRATERNLGILSRVNAHLLPVTIEYDRDVLPLSPGQNPTERHMVVAYVRAVERQVQDPPAFWAEKLGLAPYEMASVMEDAPQFQNLVRAKLMKRGGVGYVQPDSGMFPPLEAMHELILACQALPCATWLDGTSAGEESPEEWLSFLVERGAVAVNIVPDRNWNIADPRARRVKLQNLYDVVEAAQALDLPLNVGTEMNSFGQRLVDAFDAPELAPVRQAFIDGAHFVYGHTALQRALGLGYQSAWAQEHFPTRQERGEFYTRAGYLIPPGKVGQVALGRLSAVQMPRDILFDLAG